MKSATKLAQLKGDQVPELSLIPSRTILTPDSEIIRFTATDIEKRGNELSYTLKSPDKQMEVYNFPRASSSNKTAAIKQDLLSSQSTTSKTASRI